MTTANVDVDASDDRSVFELGVRDTQPTGNRADSSASDVQTSEAICAGARDLLTGRAQRPEDGSDTGAGEELTQMLPGLEAY